MIKEERCYNCREIIDPILYTNKEKRIVNGREYDFLFTKAKCPHCGEELDPTYIIDLNQKEYLDQYYKIMGLVTKDDIEKLMKIYDIGKAPLSCLLGFGEVTIPRYLMGHVPTKLYSDIILKAIREPKFIKEMAENNKEKIGIVAYKKTSIAIDKIIKSLSFSDKLFEIISYLLKEVSDITALSLQKILYYIQGFYLAIYDKPLFIEDCEAWVHGPVYRNVYNLFKDFTYVPTEDPRFIIFDKQNIKLDDNVKKIIDNIIITFGKYSGRVLENLTHKEAPWLHARNGIVDAERSNNIITKDSIKLYFDKINDTYNLLDVEEINKYIESCYSV